MEHTKIQIIFIVIGKQTYSVAVLKRFFYKTYIHLTLFFLNSNL